MISIMWRRADTGAGIPGPVQRAVGDPPIVTGLAPGTVVEVDRGDGIWWSGVVPGEAGPPVPVLSAPALAGGSLTRIGGDLIITTPTITAGHPAPTLTLTVTRDGEDVTGEVVEGRILAAPPGDYLALWTASNGVAPDAVRSSAIQIHEEDDNPPAFVVLPDATFTISPDPGTPGVWQFEVTAPAYAAGSYSITEAELAEGPVALNVPSTTGAIALGHPLITTAVVAVGIGGAISVAYEMRRNGVTLVAGDPLNYEIAPDDLGATLQVVALLSDANGGPVEVPGNTVHIPADALPVDTFDGIVNGRDLRLVTSDSGEAWARADGGTAGTAEVFWNRVYPLGAASRIHYLRGAANRGVRQWAECDIGRPGSLDRGGVSPLIRGTVANGVFVQIPRLSVNSTFIVIQKIGAASTNLFSFEAPSGWADAAANVFRLRLEVDGAAVKAFVNGVSVGTGTTSLTGGGCGLSTGDYIDNKSNSGFADNFTCGGSN